MGTASVRNQQKQKKTACVATSLCIQGTVGLKHLDLCLRLACVLRIQTKDNVIPLVFTL